MNTASKYTAMKSLKNIHFALVLAITMVFASCEQVITVDLPTTPPRLVVNSYFEPDSVFKVHVSKSANILDNAELQNISNATVIVTGPSGFREQLNYTGEGNYESASGPSIGQTYAIDVSAPNFESVSASDKIPEEIEIISIDTQNIRIDGVDYLEFRIRFEDDGNSVDYYNLWLEATDFYTTQQVGSSDTDTVWTKDHFSFSSNDLVFGQSDGFEGVDYFNFETSFEDALFNGKSYDLRIQIERTRLFGFQDDGFFIGGGPAPRDFFPDGVVKLHIYLRRVTRDYYLYSNSFNQARFSNGDIFAQPVQVHNNIENGFGIFAGFTEDQYDFDFQ